MRSANSASSKFMHSATLDPRRFPTESNARTNECIGAIVSFMILKYLPTVDALKEVYLRNKKPPERSETKLQILLIVIGYVDY